LSTPPPSSPLFPYTTLFRSTWLVRWSGPTSSPSGWSSRSSASARSTSRSRSRTEQQTHRRARGRDRTGWRQRATLPVDVELGDSVALLIRRVQPLARRVDCEVPRCPPLRRENPDRRQQSSALVNRERGNRIMPSVRHAHEPP